MDWTDEGTILAVRRHGETNVILEVFTRDHGRHLGLVRGGRSRRQQPVLQPGNHVRVTWRARLDEHLGTFTVEPVKQRAAFLFEERFRLYAFQVIASHLRLYPERDPHPDIFAFLQDMLTLLEADEPDLAAGLTLFELHLLADLGHGIDLSACAATGSREELIYVSPKSGRAVSRSAGEPYAARLLPLPSYLLERTTRWQAAEEITQAASLTGYFLHRDLYQPRNLPMPPERERLFGKPGT